MFNAFQSISEPLTDVENNVDIDAMLPQTGTKLTKKRGSKSGALLWRRLTPQSATEKNRNTGAQRRAMALITDCSLSSWLSICIQLLRKGFGKFT